MIYIRNITLFSTLRSDCYWFYWEIVWNFCKQVLQTFGPALSHSSTELWVFRPQTALNESNQIFTTFRWLQIFSGQFERPANKMRQWGNVLGMDWRKYLKIVQWRWYTGFGIFSIFFCEKMGVNQGCQYQQTKFLIVFQWQNNSL